MSTIEAALPRRMPSNRGLREVIEPHRSYRILPVSRTGALMTIPAVILVECVVAFLAQRCLDAMSAFGALVAGREGIAVRPYADPFLFVTTHPTTFAMRHSQWIELCAIIAVCLLIVVLLSVWTRIAAPVRFFANINLLLIGGAAVYLLLAGGLGYDSASFSQLMIRTALVTWLIMPLFVGLFASLFPFTLIERFAFIALAVAYDVPLSIVRYGLFIALLGKTSSIVMTDLYFVFGPLLDAIPIICFLSIFLLRVARSLEERRSTWAWL
jgi:hypothetical protein